MTDDARRSSPAAARNRDPILAVLRRHLPQRGLVREIASGSGEHIMHLARACCPDLTFQPSDPDADARRSIDAWAATLGLANLRAAIALDAAADDWPIRHADAVLCINMIHIAPWQAAEGLMRGAARVLPPEGLLYLYGPFSRGGRHTAPSNERFDQDLRHRNAAWGVRAIEGVTALADAAGFAPPLIEEMPANNLSLVFRRLESGAILTPILPSPRRDRKNGRHANSPACGGVRIDGDRGRGARVRFGSVGMASDDQGRIGGSDGRGVAVRASKGSRPTARRGGRQMAWAEVTDDLAERRPQAGGARGWRPMAARMRSMASRPLLRHPPPIGRGEVT